MPITSPAALTRFVQTVSVLSGGSKACSTAQMEQLQFGSSFIWRLHDSWELTRPIRPSNMLFVVGTQGDANQPTECNDSQGCDDGVVDISSAALPETLDDRIRYVPYKHAAIVPLPRNGTTIAGVTDSSHQSYQFVSEFLRTGNVSPPTYVAPHLRGNINKFEGLVLFRLRDGVTQGAPIFPQLLDLTFNPLVLETRDYFRQTNTDTGAVTLWGMPANEYDVNITSLFYRRTSVARLLVNVARPTVTPVVSLTRRW